MENKNTEIPSKLENAYIVSEALKPTTLASGNYVLLCCYDRNTSNAGSAARMTTGHHHKPAVLTAANAVDVMRQNAYIALSATVRCRLG